MAKQKNKKNDGWILVGVSLLVVIVALLAIFTPTTKSTSTISTKQTTQTTSQSKQFQFQPNNELSTEMYDENHLPPLPSTTKDGKPIDPHIFQYAHELEQAMKNYALEIKGAEVDFINSANKLSYAYLNAGIYQEVIRICQQTMSVIETEYTTISEQAIEPLKLLIKASSELGNVRESLEYLTFLETVMTELYGSTHELTLDVVMNIVGLYLQTGNIDNANMQSKHYLKILEAELKTFQADLDSLVVGSPSSSSSSGDADSDASFGSEVSSEEVSSSKQIYKKIQSIVKTLNFLSDMNYGLSTVWDRIEADPDGSAKLRIIRSTEDSTTTTGTQQISQEEDEETDTDVEEEEEKEEKDTTVDSEGRLKAFYPPYEVYRQQEYYRREVIYYREQIVNLITQHKQLILEESDNEQQHHNPYLIGPKLVDSRAKLAHAIQQYSYLRYQHNYLDQDTLKLFHQLVNISVDIASPSSSAAASSAVSEGLFPVSKDVAIALNNLGTLYLDVMEYNQAEYYVKQSLQLRQQLLKEKNHQQQQHHVNEEFTHQPEIDLAMCKGNLGRIYFHQSNWKEGERELREALNILNRILENSTKGNEKTTIEGYIGRLKFQLEQGNEMKNVKEKEDLPELDEE